MYAGLPEYYHQIPPYVPNFFKTLVRRKLVIWFLIAEILRNYWLSTVYGRNWEFLWHNAQVPTWSVVIMIAIFFIGVWGLLMGILISEFRDERIWLTSRIRKGPLMAPARLRRWSRMPALVPDVLGYLRSWPLRLVGRCRGSLHVSLRRPLRGTWLTSLVVPACGSGSECSTRFRVLVWV